MPLYFKLISQTFIPYFYLSYLLLFSSLLYLIYKKHLFAYISVFLIIAILFSGTESEAYFQQLLPFIFIITGIFLSRFLLSNKQIVVFLIVYLCFSITYLVSTQMMSGFSGYGLTLQDKISLVKKVGYYPWNFTIIGPGQEFKSVTDPYGYLFWYYYRNPVPKTSVILDEYNHAVSFTSEDNTSF